MAVFLLEAIVKILLLEFARVEPNSTSVNISIDQSEYIPVTVEYFRFTFEFCMKIFT